MNTYESNSCNERCSRCADADLEITLKILKNIFETGSEWKIDGGTKNVNFCMDLNGCTVTGKGLYITGEGVEAVFKEQARDRKEH